jgi:DNA-binding NarL/FixJ family response regulator
MAPTAVKEGGMMVRVVAIAEYPGLAQTAAAILRKEPQLEILRVIDSRQDLQDPAAREILLAAQAIVHVPNGPIEAVPVREMRPTTGRVLVIADLGGHVGLERALRLGALAYFGPHEAEALLGRRVLDAVQGRLAVPPGALAAAQAMVRLLARDSPHVRQLSEEEKAILPGVACGDTAKEIGAKLKIPESTVRSRIRSVRQTLGLRSEQELAAWGGTMGFYALEGEDPTEGGGR